MPILLAPMPDPRRARPSLTRRLGAAADVGRRHSFANTLRQSRFRRVHAMIGRVAAAHGPRRPVRILDVGGTVSYWWHRGALDVDYPYPIHVTAVNLADGPDDVRHPRAERVVGDATDLRAFRDGGFDLVVSNSVIEHVRDPELGVVTLERQATMAREISRVAPEYYVQTPRVWFPIEPHFRSPLAHPKLPRRLRVRELRRIAYAGLRHAHEAEHYLDGVRLLSRAELEAIFPTHTLLVPERGPRTGWITKSWQVVRTVPR